jgi:hypothetical protein
MENKRRFDVPTRFVIIRGTHNPRSVCVNPIFSVAFKFYRTSSNEAVNAYSFWLKFLLLFHNNTGKWTPMYDQQLSKLWTNEQEMPEVVKKDFKDMTYGTRHIRDTNKSFYHFNIPEISKLF